jgi:proteasome lid subunit RPN8/RPN11
VIRVRPSVLDAVRIEGRRTYPEECCGVLLGRTRAGAGGRQILEARPAANARKAERARRYLIGPEAVLRAEDEALERGLEVVGFFHSHPDHPAVPSEVDREHAWPWYSYLILSVHRGVPSEARAWRLEDDRSGFREEGLLEDGDRSPNRSEA